MSARGKLYFILAGLAGAALAVVFATQAQPAALSSPLALRQGEVRQVERSLEFSVHTAAPIELAGLDPGPTRRTAAPATSAWRWSRSLRRGR